MTGFWGWIRKEKGTKRQRFSWRISTGNRRRRKRRMLSSGTGGQSPGAPKGKSKPGTKQGNSPGKQGTFPWPFSAIPGASLSTSKHCHKPGRKKRQENKDQRLLQGEKDKAGKTASARGL